MWFNKSVKFFVFHVNVRVAVIGTARRNQRLQLQRWRRGTNLTPVTVSRDIFTII